MTAFSLAWRQLCSHWASGEVRVLLFALVLAVAATTAVSFFTDRIQGALVSQGGLLLGADLVVIAGHPLPEKYLQQARKRQLKTTQTIEFPSMIVQGKSNQLAQIKALGEGFPLRGELTIIDAETRQSRAATTIPEAGTVWIEPQLSSLLAVGVGESVEVGARKMKISAILQQEPSRGGDMFSFCAKTNDERN